MNSKLEIEEKKYIIIDNYILVKVLGLNSYLKNIIRMKDINGFKNILKSCKETEL